VSSRRNLVGLDHTLTRRSPHRYVLTNTSFVLLHLELPLAMILACPSKLGIAHYQEKNR